MYDDEGDVIENGIFLLEPDNHNFILRFVNSDELHAFGEHCIAMSKEIYENYKY